MNSLDELPELMTIKEVADKLKVRPASIYRMKGLVKIRLGEGRGFYRIRLKDFVSFINRAVEINGEVNHASVKTERQRKVGVPSIISWKELQKILIQHTGRCIAG